MTHSTLLLNDGSSVLLNDGSSVVLLNEESPEHGFQFDSLLLNDGTSNVLLNNGTDHVLLNSQSVAVGTDGVQLVGDFSRVVDFRDFRAPAKQFATCIIGISCKIQIFTSPLVESKIKRQDAMPLQSKLRKESKFDGISKIYHESLHNTKGRITHDIKLHEVNGMNDSQAKTKHYKDLLEDINSKKIRKEKIDEIKKMYKEYKYD